ncbi:LysR family transcriptional regulator [Formosimonas limnophila]|uniref:LysR family transcriptional regulator n=1 Tax=Formosimonas limnophila TaxID=1384487 RepID=A0A8J3FZK6_9BURK|nr:LysR family transcriptional regulator [Formosimonas limnophila]GHA75020.1 LysR family transcriptional regulator [Formosimonas limnophila]
MNKIDLRRIDLNLLLIFEVLMHERSVTRTAEALNRTQSAISHALARLREQLGDPLLVKAGGVMQPSPFALQLVEEVRPILRNIERVLQPHETFEPHTSKLNFRIALPDVVPNLFPLIAQSFIQQAPNALLEWCNVGDKVLMQIAEGQVDACLAPAHLRTVDGVTSCDMGGLEWACYMRRQHPAASQTWTAELWQSHSHIAVRVGDSPHNPVGKSSINAGLTRHVAIWVPKFSAIAPILAQTDLIATMPKILMQDSLRELDLVQRPVPYEQQPISQRLYWAERYNNDPANQWLRQLIKQHFETLQSAVETD